MKNIFQHGIERESTDDERGTRTHEDKERDIHTV